MGSLSNLYISQSFQSLIHLGSDTTITTASVQLQDGFGNGTGIFVNSLGDVFLSGSLSASLTEGYTWVGDSNNRTKLVSTASFGGTTDLTSLNAFTSSQNTKNSTLASVTASLNAYTASNDTKWSTLGGQTGSYVTSAITASSIVDIFSTLVDNQFTYTKGDGSQQTVTLNSSGGGTIPAGTVSSSAQIVQLGFLQTSSFNSYTSSTNSSISQLNASSASQQISINALNAATSSYVTSAITASSIITASVVNDDITFTKGDGSQFTIQVATGSFALSASYAEYAETASIASNLIVTARNGDASTLAAGTVVHITGASGDNPIFTTASYDNEALSSNTFGLLRYSSPSGADVEVVVGGIVTSVNTDPALGYVAGDILYLSSSGQFTNIQPQAPLQIVTIGQVLRAQQNNGSIYVSINNGWELNELHNVQINNPLTGDLLQYESSSYGLWKNKTIDGAGIATTASFNAYTASNDTKWITIGALTGSYATTGSNVFTGDQTLVDASGNTVTLSDISGSLVLVAKSYTSASAHISSSANNVNLLFKNNNNTTDTIISGSNNILGNAAAATAGFKKYVSNNNIFLNGQLPEITGSITFSPTVNANIGNGLIRFRAPVSSSAWTLSNNNLNAGFNIGSADATSANQAIAGGNITNNMLLAAVNYNAYTTPLVAAANFQNSFVIGTTTLTAFSSSIQASNNIFNGNAFTINNRYFGTSAIPAAQRLQLAYNVFGGINSSTLTAEGSNTSTGVAREVIGNTTNGSGLSLGVILSGDNSSLLSTLIHGSNLTVTGSSANNNYNTAGSTFIGRNNAVDGTKASSAETIFAVGTGIGTGARKTGFLIDSGSNTFVDGTFNVTGTTSLNGNLIITGSLTASLQQGYVWVGDAAGKTITVATSSFGGGGAAFPYTGNAQISGSLGVTGSFSGFVNTLVVTGTTASLDFSLGNMFKLTLPSASTTYFNPSNIKAGQTINVQLTQQTPGTGSVSFAPSIKFAGGADYQATATGSAIDLITFISLDGTNVLATSIKNFL